VKGTYFETEESLAARSGLDGINRKIQEIALALEAETLIDKERILEMYLNRINFGVPQNRRGIQTAAEFYFGKDVSELNLVESAMLAGVINAPNAYNPIKNLELATERTHIVLDLMVYHGYISEQEAEIAKSIPIENLIVGELVSGVEASGAKPYQAYVDAVIEEVKAVTGYDPALKSMTIYTSLDSALQSHFEAILNGEIESVAFPNDIIQSSMISLNQSTGEILAIGGGRFYYGERLFNRATDMYRQPGSSAKLILTYPLAFEYLGWSTQHILHDRPIIYQGTDVVIKNFDDVYRGDVSIAYAIGNSLNIPAIETMQNVDEAIGPEATIAYLNSIGFDQVNASNYDLGYGIGGSLFKASPLQMAQAYGAMLNGGQFNEAHTVLKIEYQDDEEDYVYQSDSKTVLSPAAAFITASMMEQDVSGPYRNFMQILDRSYSVYAKTGTSDWGDTGLEFGIPSGSAKDKWMITGTSEITTAVWVGYDQAVKDQISYLDQAQINLNLPGKINSSILDAYYANNTKPKDITRPSDVVDLTHVSGVYPYVSPSATTSPSLIVTGLVKEEFSSLSTLASPVAFYQSVGVYNGEVLNGQVKGYDPYSSYLYFTVVDYPSHGQLTFDGSTGQYTYTHSGDEQADFFTFTASYSSPQRVDINILPKKETE
jgi:penicillin-binding protein 1A